MNIDLATLSASSVYHLMVQSLIPRPIAWVLSEYEGGGFNVAPFSYFNAISSDPPLLMLSIGKKPGGDIKDTRMNIIERSYFVIHLPHCAQAEQVNTSSKTLAAGNSELQLIDEELCEFEGFSLPRIKNCPVAFACERYRVEDITSTQALIIGRVKQIYLADEVVHTEAGRLHVDAKAVDPLMRLGGTQYASLGAIFAIDRPK